MMHGVDSEGISFFRHVLPRGDPTAAPDPADLRNNMLHRVGKLVGTLKQKKVPNVTEFAFWAVSDVNGEDLRAFAGLEMQQS